jgi:protein-S-isoprenylcysteine O-methyltransferase Ste14
VTPLDPHLIVRAGALYVATILTLAVWLWRRPSRRAWNAAILASLWNIPVLLTTNLAAAYAGWWHFDADGGLLLGTPVDLLLAWAWLWGAVPALAVPAAPLPIVVGAACALDLALMPAAAPVVRLGPQWLAGEAVAAAAVLVPAQLLARWTTRGERLVGRAVIQMVGFVGIVGLCVPAIAIEGSNGPWVNPLALSGWQFSILAQALALPALLGCTAVQEFVTRGGGTPVPFDPPRRLVTSGVYAFVRNPMQLSGVLLLVTLGIGLRSAWVAAAGLMAHIYAIGLAGWDEDHDLRQRFGDDWAAYHLAVPRWVPRLRPWRRSSAAPARLYVSESCGMCSELGRWFARRGVNGLDIVAAESHPSRALRRITYEPGDGSRAATGTEAIARALEHVHLGWALAGFAMRLPVICSIVQLIVDACGGEPRSIPTASRGPAPPAR